MAGHVAELTGRITAADRYDYHPTEVEAAQIAALAERFEDRSGRIRLLGHRAKEAGIQQITAFEDVVPVLFPHTAYKSYPESFLAEQRWDRLTKWLATVSPYPIEPTDPADIGDIDAWIARLEQAGHYISCSSGTTGKSAMLIASGRDMDWTRLDTVGVFAWGSGVAPAHDRKFIGCAPVASVPKNRISGEAHYAAFANPAWPRFDYPVPPITVGQLTRMVVMRKKIADGTALPQEVADFERTSQERQAVLDAAIGLTADALIANRDKKLMVAGLWSGLYAVAKAVRERGYTAADFHPDNCIYVGGGLKRALLPPDYQQFVHETFNIPAGRHFQNYSMQELNSGMPKCQAGGRYHVPPWIVPLVLDKEGNALADDYRRARQHGGQIEGRAAFFDLSLDGRWGGVITGDRITLDFSPCPCGNHGPSIADTIVRYADLEGDDKIGCAGTVDAYVRGVS